MVSISGCWAMISGRLSISPSSNTKNSPSINLFAFTVFTFKNTSGSIRQTPVTVDRYHREVCSRSLQVAEESSWLSCPYSIPVSWRLSDRLQIIGNRLGVSDGMPTIWGPVDIPA